MNYQKHIVINPNVRSGKPCIINTRIAVADVFDYLGGGMTVDEILDDFPDLTAKDIQACFAFVADRDRRLAIAPYEIAVWWKPITKATFFAFFRFSNSVHVRDLGLKGFSDQDIWEYARNHGLIIVSKDSDFYQRSLFFGHPPKVVWLRIGNCSRSQVIELIRKYKQEIYSFNSDRLESVLVVY